LFRFRCKKCKNTFAVEQHPLFQSLKDKLNAEPKGFSDNETLKAFSETILEITKQIRCQQCQSTVYLIGVADISFETGVDATSEPLVKAIKGLVDLHKEYKSKTSTPDSFLKYSAEVGEYAQEIAEHLMWHPGSLVYFEDSELMTDAKIAIHELWKNLSYDELSDEMFSGGFSGLMVNIVGDYIERVKMIKPTFITVKPNNEIRTYFQQAMDAWSYGLNTASLILSCSILEAILKQILLKKDSKLVYDFGKGKSFKDIKEKDLEVLIENAKLKKILDDTEAKKADKIRKSRNAAVHKLKQISSDDTYKAIITTKELLEKLLA
jgi:hypothetical protein